MTLGAKALHAEQVGVGALFCTFLRGDSGRFTQLDGVPAPPRPAADCRPTSG